VEPLDPSVPFGDLCWREFLGGPASMIMNCAFSLAALLLGVLVSSQGWLGIALDPKEPHPTVIEVIPGSPAEQAGLRPGDSIVSVGGRPTLTLDQLISAIGDLSAGDRVTIVVSRGRKRIDLSAKLGVRPQGHAIGLPARH